MPTTAPAYILLFFPITVHPSIITLGPIFVPSPISTGADDAVRPYLYLLTDYRADVQSRSDEYSCEYELLYHPSMFLSDSLRSSGVPAAGTPIPINLIRACKLVNPELFFQGSNHKITQLRLLSSTDISYTVTFFQLIDAAEAFPLPNAAGRRAITGRRKRALSTPARSGTFSSSVFRLHHHQPAYLGKAFQNQNSRHDGPSWVMAGKVGFIDGNVLNRHSPFARYQLHHPIDHQKRISVGQTVLYSQDIQHRARPLSLLSHCNAWPTACQGTSRPVTGQAQISAVMIWEESPIFRRLNRPWTTALSPIKECSSRISALIKALVICAPLAMDTYGPIQQFSKTAEGSIYTGGITITSERLEKGV